MQYKADGNKILKYTGGRWKVLETCSSPIVAKKALKMLQQDPKFGKEEKEEKKSLYME